MASKLVVVLVAAMAALVVVTHATFMANDVTDDNDRGSGRCRAELQSKWPENCERYMKQGMMMMVRYKHHDNDGDDDDDQMRDHHGQYFDQCCDELQSIEPECQCEAMKMMMQEMTKMSQQGERRMPRQMVEKAMEIPMMCGTMQHKCRMSYMHNNA